MGNGSKKTTIKAEKERELRQSQGATSQLHTATTNSNLQFPNA